MTEQSPREYSLFVDGREFRVALSRVSGTQVRALAAVSPEYGLVLEGRGTDPDTPVSDEQFIELTGEVPRLFTHPPTTFGTSQAQ